MCGVVERSGGCLAKFVDSGVFGGSGARPEGSFAMDIAFRRDDPRMCVETYQSRDIERVAIAC